jgi:phenylpyruvate tautomerase PptA (4-oxalocrotonate tautomerase family)
MPFVELFVTKGSLDPAQRRQIGERLVTEVMKAEGAPDTPEARSISWLVVHEPSEWWVGGELTGADDQPRYLVRVSVPAASLDDAKRADIVERVTNVLADVEPDPERLRRSPAAWVHLIEIPEGNWGGAGRVVRFKDVMAFVTAGAPTG